MAESADAPGSNSGVPQAHEGSTPSDGISDQRLGRRSGKGAGRRPKITPAIIKAVCDNLRAGIPLLTSLRLAGLTYNTHARWKRRATTHPGTLYGDYLRALRLAEAESERALLGIVVTSAAGQAAQYDKDGNEIRPYRPPNWVAATWMLERRFPKRYGRRDHVQVDAKVQAELTVSPKIAGGRYVDAPVRDVPEDEIAALEAAAQAKLGAGGSSGG